VCQEISDSIKQKLVETEKFMTEELNNIKKKIKESDIWGSPQRYFFGSSKHPNVTIVNPTTVKSAGTGQGYKFALLEPDLGSVNSKPKTFAFKIKENHSSNWIALGVCHKKIIVQKSYSFTFSTLGHGAYMVSSNGGSWSNC
jgi:hypothetical protein